MRPGMKSIKVNAEIWLIVGSDSAEQEDRLIDDYLRHEVGGSRSNENGYIELTKICKIKKIKQTQHQRR